MCFLYIYTFIIYCFSVVLFFLDIRIPMLVKRIELPASYIFYYLFFHIHAYFICTLILICIRSCVTKMLIDFSYIIMLYCTVVYFVSICNCEPAKLEFKESLFERPREPHTNAGKFSFKNDSLCVPHSDSNFLYIPVYTYI